MKHVNILVALEGSDNICPLYTNKYLEIYSALTVTLFCVIDHIT